MLVDDDPEVRDILLDCIDENLYHVYQADNGCQALDILKLRKIDVLLTDIHLPHMNGVDLLEELQKLNLDLVVHVVSGSSVGPLIERCKELGAQSIIEKPFRSEDILRAISHKTDTEAA